MERLSPCAEMPVHSQVIPVIRAKYKFPELRIYLQMEILVLYISVYNLKKNILDKHLHFKANKTENQSIPQSFWYHAQYFSTAEDNNKKLN